MRQDLAEFLALPANDRRGLLQTTVRRLDNEPSDVEKDLWMCVVLDTIFNNLPADHPRIFKARSAPAPGLALDAPAHPERDRIFGFLRLAETESVIQFGYSLAWPLVAESLPLLLAEDSR